MLSGCSGPSREARAPLTSRPSAHGDPIEFSFPTITGTLFDSNATRGRATAVLFVTTYDLASQVAARRLNEVVFEQRPRVNAGAVVLEQPKYALLVDAFRSALELRYPVAIADYLTLSGGGPFGAVDRVPLIVVLDYRGREVWRQAGVAEKQDIQEALAAGSRPGLTSER